MQKYIESIECPNCEKKLRPPFRACRRDHLVCPNCHQHQNATTGAQITYGCGEQEFAMPVLNKMFKTMLDTCQYGCGFAANLIELEQHEKICTRHDKIVKCSVPLCTWSGVLSKLPQHVEDGHPRQLVDLSIQGYNFIAQFNNPVMLVTQFGTQSYWLRLFDNGCDRYVILLRQNTSLSEDESRRRLKEYTISSVNKTNLIISANVIQNTDDDLSINNNDFVVSKGANITPLTGDSFCISIKNPTMSVVPESIMLMLECIVCMDMMHSPIMQCSSGHSYCSKCAAKIKTCPTCKKKLSNTRNYGLEQLSENLESKCKYKENGCCITGTAENMALHIKKCVFQPTECASYGCSWTGCYNDVLKHWKDKHSNRVKNNGSSFLSELSRILYKVDGHYFLFTGVYDNNYYLSMHHLTFDEKSDFYFDLEFFNPVTSDSVGFSRHCVASTSKDTKNDEYLKTASNVCMISKKWFTEVINDSNKKFIWTINIYHKLL